MYRRKPARRRNQRMTGKQSPDAPVGSSWLHGSGGGHGESPLYRARLVSPAVLYKAVVNEVGPPPRRLLSSIAREASECPTRPPQTWQVAEVQYHCTPLYTPNVVE